MWYLPDRNPLILDEMRRRLRGAFLYWTLLVFILAFGALLGVAVMMAWPGGDVQKWAAFGKRLWISMAVIQIVLSTCIGPALTAGAFSGERERGTAELLWITPLSSWSIVTGKFWGAIFTLLLVIFAGLPVTAMTSLFGGVGLWEVLLGTFGTMLAGAFYAALGLLASVNSHETRKAVFLAYFYLMVSLFVILGTCGLAIVLMPVATLLALLSCTGKLNNLRKPDGFMLVRASYRMERYLLARPDEALGEDR